MNTNQFTYFSKNNKEKWSELKTKKIAIILTDWNPKIVNDLGQAAIKLLDFAGLKYKVFKVAGAFEIPYLAKIIFSKNKGFDGIVALGCVLKGETLHFEMIALTTSINLSSISIEMKKPIGFGILTVNTIEQAKNRSQMDNNNKGLEATAAVLDLLVVENQLN